MKVEQNGPIFDIYIDEGHYTHPVEINDCTAQAFPQQMRTVTKEQLEMLLSSPATKAILLNSELMIKVS